jgi:hypothetical protein
LTHLPSKKLIRRPEERTGESVSGKRFSGNSPLSPEIEKKLLSCYHSATIMTNSRVKDCKSGKDELGFKLQNTYS